MNPKHDCHGLINLIAALITQDKLFEQLLLLMEIASQKPDNFLTGMVLRKVINPHNELYFPVLFDGQIFLRFPDVLMIYAHAASLINHSSQGFLNAHPLHFQFEGESLGMNTPLDIPFQTSIIFLAALCSSTSLLVV